MVRSESGGSSAAIVVIIIGGVALVLLLGCAGLAAFGYLFMARSSAPQTAVPVFTTSEQVIDEPAPPAEQAFVETSPE